MFFHSFTPVRGGCESRQVRDNRDMQQEANTLRMPVPHTNKVLAMPYSMPRAHPRAARPERNPQENALPQSLIPCEPWG